ELVVPVDGPDQAGRVPSLRLGERHADPLAEEPVETGLVQALGVREQPAALTGELVELQPETAVEVDVVLRAEVAHAVAGDCRRGRRRGPTRAGWRPRASSGPRSVRRSARSRARP